MHLVKRWKLVVVAVTTAFAVALPAGAASAAMPGEGSWTPDTVGDGGTGQTQFRSSDVPAFAYNQADNEMAIWEAADGSGNIWFAFSGGNPFQIPGGGITHDAPAIVPFGSFGFAAFHTGTDDRIYMATSTSGQQGTWTGWTAIGNDRTPFSPSVAQINGSGSRELYLVYRSDDDQRTIWSRYFSGAAWSDALRLGGTTDHSPAVAWNPASRRIFVAHTGTDGHAYINSSPYGSDPDPNNWRSRGGGLYGRPTIAANDDGNMLMGAIAPRSGGGSDSWFLQMISSGTPIGDWHEDANRLYAVGAVTLLATFHTFTAYVINRQNNGLLPLQVLFKNAWNSGQFGG